MSCGPNIRRRTRPTPTNDGTVLRPTAGCTHSRPRRIPINPSGRQFPIRIRGSDPFLILRSGRCDPSGRTYALSLCGRVDPRNTVACGPVPSGISGNAPRSTRPLLPQREQTCRTPPRTQTDRPAGRLRKCSVRHIGKRSSEHTGRSCRSWYRPAAPRPERKQADPPDDSGNAQSGNRGTLLGRARAAPDAAGAGRPHPAPNANRQTSRPIPEMLSPAYRGTLLGRARAAPDAAGADLPHPAPNANRQTCRPTPEMLSPAKTRGRTRFSSRISLYSIQKNRLRRRVTASGRPALFFH